MTEYVVRAGGEIRCATDWRPMAAAAWFRATSDWNTNRDGGDVELLVNGECVTRASARTRKAARWPVEGETSVDLCDVSAAVLQLCRAAGISAGDLADEMTDQGLPTTRSRLKSISTIEEGRQSNASAAEIVVMCYAAISRLKNDAR